jgi:hypothetical protein
MLAWGLPSGVSGVCDNTLIPEWRCPVKRPSQDTGSTEQTASMFIHQYVIYTHATLVHKDPEFEQLEATIKVLKLPYKVGS